MRAILIDPVDKSLTEITTPGVVTKDVRELLQCRLCETVAVDGKNILLVDEEGLLKDDPGPFFTFGHHEQPIAGRGLVFGLTAHGDLTNVEMSIALAQAMVAWPDVELEGFETLDGSTTRDWMGMDMPIYGSRAKFRKKRHGT